MFLDKHFSEVAPSPSGYEFQLKLSNFPSFWILQILGWSGYGFHRWLINPDFFNNKFVYLLVGFALTSLVRYFYRELWKTNRSLYFILPILVLTSIIGGVVYVLTARLILVSLGSAVFADQPFHLLLFEAFQNSFLHNKTFVFFSWSALYFGIKYWRDTAILREQSHEAQIIAREAQLEMLRYQINPHFLFNSLNSIHALVSRNPSGAEKMIEQLSALLRYSLSNSEVFQSSLREEFEIALKYLEIEKIRFEEMIEFESSIGAAVEEFTVPSFIIHPLVENAVKYGMKTGELPLRIKLSAEKIGESVRVEVANSGRLLDGRSRSVFARGESTGIGLKNIRRRLETVFPQTHDFSIYESGGWVRAVIEIKINEARFEAKKLESVDR